MGNTKTIINALAAMHPTSSGHTSRITLLFGDQPDVLNAILDARKRRCSFRQIAMALSTDEQKVSPGAVQNWLAAKGIK